MSYLPTGSNFNSNGWWVEVLRRFVVTQLRRFNGKETMFLVALERKGAKIRLALELV